jgi:2,4-dienoyl-CoA reductase-like NADH-dependent reductase (Old Yellow Enzyme family)
MPQLFDPFTLKSITLRNRIGVSPMCQYSSENGHASDWHLVHLGTRATGGAGLVMMEATAVTPEGRITPQDNGIYLDSHIAKLKQITTFIKSQGAVPAIQIAHAGRKASRQVPWEGDSPASEENGWTVVAPSAIAFDDGYQVPHPLSVTEISEVIRAFKDGAKRAFDAGFELLEIHAAHGYLLHSFLSPIANHRTDTYGGSFENRIRIVLEVVEAVKTVWPSHLPIAVRLSCTDWVESNGWTITDSVFLSMELKKLGIDLIDCSSGAIAPKIKIPIKKQFQVPFAEEIKKKVGIATAAVGLITEAKESNSLIYKERADMVFLARELLRNPYWPIQSAQILHRLTPGLIPNQYLRGF